MRNNLIEIGQIVNTHGIKGELRLQPWADAPDSLLNVTQIYLNNQPVKLKSAKKHKSNLIISLDGVDNLSDAIKLKNKTVSALRSEIKLDEGSYFIADLIGLRVIDITTGNEMGVLKDVLTLPKHNVYVVEGEREILIPAVPEFVKETNIDEGYVKILPIEGL